MSSSCSASYSTVFTCAPHHAHRTHRASHTSLIPMHRHRDALAHAQCLHGSNVAHHVPPRKPRVKHSQCVAVGRTVRSVAARARHHSAPASLGRPYGIHRRALSNLRRTSPGAASRKRDRAPSRLAPRRQARLCASRARRAAHSKSQPVVHNQQKPAGAIPPAAALLSAQAVLVQPRLPSLQEAQAQAAPLQAMRPLPPSPQPSPWLADRQSIVLPPACRGR